MSFLMNIYRYVASLIHTTFDGTNEYVAISDDASISFERTDSFSVSSWIYPDTSQDINYIGKFNGLSGVKGYCIGVRSNEELIFILSNNSSSDAIIQLSANSVFNVNEWSNIIVTYDGSSLASGVEFYVNGSIVSKVAATRDSLTSTTQNTNDLNIGTSYQPGSVFDGKMDKVIIYDDILTSGEATTIYNYGRETGLIGIGNEVSQWELDTLNPVDVIENTWTTFDGVNEYISANGLATSCATNTIGSWSCWINTSDITPTTSGNILGFGDTNANYYVRILLHTSGKIYGNASKNGVIQWQFNETSTSPLTDNTWHHIAFVQDGVEPKLYIDGSLISITFTTSTNKTSWNNSIPTLDNFTIGALLYNSINYQLFNGKIDKVIVYDDVLTSGEVTEIYNYGRKAGLIGIGNEVSQWELDTLNPSDEIGSNDGTSTNMDSTNIVDDINDGTSVNMDSSNIVIG